MSSTSTKSRSWDFILPIISNFILCIYIFFFYEYYSCSVVVLVKFFVILEVTKFSQNFVEILGETFGNISPPTSAISLPFKN